MVKSSKRKKEKKADFQKAKLKLGKGKQVATNATDISFKAKTIALPQQSIVSDKSGKLVNSRNLTVSELAVQLRHFSANVRKDAIAGIREILSMHPVLLSSAVAHFLPDAARCIGDDDGTVRKQLQGLLDWALPRIPSQHLAPFHSTLLLYTTSALSHIYPEVRLDAIKVLDICLQLIPHVATVGWEVAVRKMVDATTATQGFGKVHSSSASTSTAGQSSTGHQLHGERIMNCYLNLLGITQRSASSASITATDLSTSSKLAIFKSLRTFLSVALPNEEESSQKDQGRKESTCPTWFFRSSFSSLAEFEYFQGLLNRAVRRNKNKGSDMLASSAPSTDERGSETDDFSFDRAEYHSAECGRGSLMDLSSSIGKSVGGADLFASLQKAANALPASMDASLAASNDSAAFASRSAALSLYALLDPVLLATFLDTAPTAFQPEMDLSLQRNQPSAQSAGLSTPAQIIFELITLILTLWRSSSSSPFVAARASLSTMLGHMSIYFPCSEQVGSAGLSHKARSLVLQMDLAYAELTALLTLDNNGAKFKNKFNIENQIQNVSSFIADLLSTPVTEGGTVSLGSTNSSRALDEETFRALLPTLWFLLGSDHATLLDNLLKTYHGYGKNHSVKPVLFEFLARIYLLSQIDARTCIPGTASDKVLESLLSNLPRMLWETSSSASTHHFAGLLLDFLHFVLLLPSAPANLAYEQFRAYYWLKHPTKGVEGPGPFKRLPGDSRKLALDMTSLLLCKNESLDEAIRAAQGNVA